MELTMQMRRSLIDRALDALTEKQSTRTRRVKPAAPAEDCEFPEECEKDAAGDEDLATEMLSAYCDKCPLMRL